MTYNGVQVLHYDASTNYDCKGFDREYYKVSSIGGTSEDIVGTSEVTVGTSEDIVGTSEVTVGASADTGSTSEVQEHWRYMMEVSNTRDSRISVVLFTVFFTSFSIRCQILIAQCTVHGVLGISLNQGLLILG